jgi:hypothetical protein
MIAMNREYRNCDIDVWIFVVDVIKHSSRSSVSTLIS